MRRTEYRLTITWPARNGAEPHAYDKHYAQEPRAAKAAAAYIAEGASVMIEVWRQDNDADWHFDAERTEAIRNGKWQLWGVS